MGDKRRVLLIEDNPGDARLIQEMLSEASDISFDLECADRLSTGLAHLAAEDTDVILLDLGLPDSQGLETFTRVHAQAPEAPIVVLTGLDDVTLATRAVREGAQDYLVKNELYGNLLVRATHYAIERKWAEKRIRHLNSVLKAIRSVNQLIMVEKDRDHLLQKACDALIEARGYEAAWLGFLSDGGTFATVKGCGFRQCLSLLGEHVLSGDHPPCVKNALVQKDLVVVDKSAACGDCLFKDACVNKKVAIIRVERAERLFGLLAISLTADVTADQEEKELLKEVAGDIAFALHNMETEEARKRAEETLRETKERYRILAEQAGQMTYDYDVPTNQISWSGDVQTITGYTLNEFQKVDVSGWEKLIHPDDREMVLASLAKAIEKCSNYRVEYRFRRKDGAYLFMEDNGLFLADENGIACQMIGIMKDISERKQAEEALRESERQHKKLYSMVRLMCDNLPDLIWTKDLEGKFVFANKACCDVLLNAKDTDEPIGKTDIYFANREKESHPENPDYHTFGETCTGSDLAVLETKKPQRFDKFGNVKGAFIFLDVYKSPFWDRNGDLIGTVGCAKIVTKEKQMEEERKRANKALQRYAERLRTLRAIDGAILAAWSPEEIAQAALRHIRRLIPCLGGIVVMFDFEAQEAILFAVHVNDEVGLGTGTRLSIEGVVGIEALRQGKVLVEEDVLALLSAGSGQGSQPPPVIRAAQAAGVRSYVAVPLIAGGELIGVLALGAESPNAFAPEHVDITREVADQVAVAMHQARLRAALETEEQRLEALVEHLPEGVLLLDAERRILLVNPVAENYLLALTGAAGPSASHVGDVLTYLADWPVDELAQFSPDGLWRELEVVGPPRRLFGVTAKPMGTETQAEGWVLLIWDVTHEREVQQRIQLHDRLAAVGQLAAGIAHDFNNIMAVIVLYAQMLLRASDLSSRNRERLATIHQQARHAANLTQQILDFGRRSILERHPLNLVPFLKELLKMLGRTLPENVKLELAYGSDDYVVNADPTRMQQVFVNLALNTRDAMPEGGKLRIELAQLQVEPGEPPPLHEMSPGAWVQVIVSDNGTGIPPEVLPHIFEPFFTTKAPGQGSGLGLAQVYGIVTQHEGYIGVESEVGRGTAFTLYLPALPVPQVELPALEIAASAEGHGETILVVEDDPAAREALVDSLEMLNYRVLQAADGQEALTIFEQHSDEIRLVLSDMVMPGVGGKELVQKLTKMNPHLKALAVTGYTLAEDVQELREMGILDVIQKPVEVDALAKAIRRALDAE